MSLPHGLQSILLCSSQQHKAPFHMHVSPMLGCTALAQKTWVPDGTEPWTQLRPKLGCNSLRPGSGVLPDFVEHQCLLEHHTLCLMPERSGHVAWVWHLSISGVRCLSQPETGLASRVFCDARILFTGVLSDLVIACGDCA